ncbi:type I restriction endonuclease [Specibacter sp. RAF43]|uniref:type I restriction endonuclease n=1 Tax=Specibacter sp. RAF43 TaxID=3233057 RepID=UPI003F964747
MEFVEKLAALSSKVQSQKSVIETEEATKNAFIMPFISAVLGYDVFNPLEVVPEFTADVGIKRGEKIDYAIMRDGVIQILIECKRSIGELKIEHASQLFRYFAATNARIAVLTNGEVYQFYTDLDAPNRMDAKPYLVLDLNDVDETLIPELQKLTKADFDLDSVISAAEELKYVGQLKRAIGALFRNPEDDWVKFLTAKVYEGAFTQKVREQFRGLTAKASRQFLTDQVNDRLKTALGQSTDVQVLQPTAAPSVTSEKAVEDHLDSEDGIVTTFEETQGFQIVRAILCKDVKASRVVPRDAKSYFAIILDDNNRKPLARLHFNRTQKYLGLFDAEKNETRHPIETLEEIYNFAETLRETLRNYA